MTASRGDRPQRRRLWPGLARRAVSGRGDLALVLVDGCLVAGAYGLMMFVRFDGRIPPGYLDALTLFLPAAVGVHLLSNWAWGLYGQMWHHASVQEARRVLLSTICALGLLAGLFLFDRRVVVPISVLGLGAVLVVPFTGAVRFHARLFAFQRNRAGSRASRIVVAGAGESGGAIVRELLRNGDGLLPVAIVDDDPRKQHRQLQGVPVVGGIDATAATVEKFGADQVLMAIPSAGSELVRRLANETDRAGVPLKVLPSVRELVNAPPTARHICDLQIADLLGRAQVTTDLDAVGRLLTGRCVLITGGGGSIGAEIAKQVAALDPGRLVLVDHDETHLYEAAAALPGDAEQVLTDVRDRDRVEAIFARFRPDVIFHAAAHKHVPMLEVHPREAISTNILGTRNVVEAAVSCGTPRFVLISTDKAVRPSSVMGATKRIAEQIVLSRSSEGRSYCGVRFGNVLGSRGSVVPRFMAQIERGGPVTVTHPNMTRYFMSIPEAVQLVLQAAAFATCGAKRIFMLDMGEAVRIQELAERMIRLSGRRVGLDIQIEHCGIRPGEKLVEELHTVAEPVIPTPHPSISAVATQVLRREEFDPWLLRLHSVEAAGEDRDARRALQDTVAMLEGLPAPVLIDEPGVDGLDPALGDLEAKHGSH